MFYVRKIEEKIKRTSQTLRILLKNNIPPHPTGISYFIAFTFHACGTDLTYVWYVGTCYNKGVAELYTYKT